MTDWQILGNPEADFEQMLNGYSAAGIGWELRDGAIVSRGSEAFEASVRQAAPARQESGLQTAQNEIHEALTDLSQAPARRYWRNSARDGGAGVCRARCFWGW